MKLIKLLSVISLFALMSCASVRVNADYDKNVNFSQYKTYAFHKTGIDKVEISDLDKKRILRAIDAQMTAKGFVKSENPDVLINIFTKEKERVDVNNYGYGWGYGYNPYFWGGRPYVSTSTEGTLYIDVIDAKNKELVWQGIGTGYLTHNTQKKDECINAFVTQILTQYPPQVK